MKAVRTKVGDTEVLIEAMIDDDLEILDEDRQERMTEPTGVSEDLKEAYDKSKSIIKYIASDIGSQIMSMKDNGGPKKTEMELNLGFSAQANAWILSGKADCVFKYKLTWEVE